MSHRSRLTKTHGLVLRVSEDVIVGDITIVNRDFIKDYEEPESRAYKRLAEEVRSGVSFLLIILQVLRKMEEQRYSLPTA